MRSNRNLDTNVRVKRPSVIIISYSIGFIIAFLAANVPYTCVITWGFFFFFSHIFKFFLSVLGSWRAINHQPVVIILPFSVRNATL